MKIPQALGDGGGSNMAKASNPNMELERIPIDGRIRASVDGRKALAGCDEARRIYQTEG